MGSEIHTLVATANQSFIHGDRMTACLSIKKICDYIRDKFVNNEVVPESVQKYSKIVLTDIWLLCGELSEFADDISDRRFEEMYNQFRDLMLAYTQDCLIPWVRGEVPMEN
jgi:hypothetical protein